MQFLLHEKFEHENAKHVYRERESQNGQHNGLIFRIYKEFIKIRKM